VTALIAEPAIATTTSSLSAIYAAQRAAFTTSGAPDYARRMRALGTLRDLLQSNRAALADAISDDFGGRSRDETLILEVLPLLDEIAHARRSLAKWMRPKRVSGTWFLLPASAYVVHQPLGVVGVIGAWNYPLLLTLGPLIDALAAGNHVMLKPSELTPRCAELIAQMIGEGFPHDYVTVITGGPEVASEFSALPFDHLLFTGSTRVGAMVMRAASDNLTPVTLELGGKSPAIVHASYPIERAIHRIIVGKLYNAGQTCIAPDYVLVPRGREAEVERAAQEIVPRLYPTLVGNPDYTRILSRGHYARLETALADAAARGARVMPINPRSEQCTRENKVIAPTLVFDVPGDATLMRDEIFGPILPVMTYASFDEAIRFVNARPRPLALYYFDDDRDRVTRLLRETTAGGVTINDVLLHIGQHALPFGGVGSSGLGRYHGRAGFETFSNRKGVTMQRRIRLTGLLAPPFTEKTRSLIRRLLAIAGRSG
jgi:coniferyl-aldehyde dehydrogenase